MSLRQSSDARVISARKGMVEQVVQVWSYRGLLVRMVRKELQVKYKNSVLGFVWSMLNPALYLVIFYVVFQLVLGAGIPNFAIFLLAGLLPWNLFSTALSSATVSVTSNGPLVGKVYFPREILPLASVGASLVHFFLQSVVLVGALVVLRLDVGFVHLPAVVVALAVLLVLAAAMGLLLAAANVYLRDVEHLVEIALLAWFWMTPIVYQHRLVADQLADKSYAWIQWLNPLTTIVLVFQRAIYNAVEVVNGNPSPRAIAQPEGDVLGILPHGIDFGWYLSHLGPVALVAASLFVLGLFVFGRLEGNFAEEL